MTTPTTELMAVSFPLLLPLVVGAMLLVSFTVLLMLLSFRFTGQHAYAIAQKLRGQSSAGVAWSVTLVSLGVVTGALYIVLNGLELATTSPNWRWPLHALWMLAPPVLGYVGWHEARRGASRKAISSP